jgi:hypothetical protein
MERDGPLPPLDLHFKPADPGTKPAAVARTPPRATPLEPTRTAATDSDWLSLNFDELQKEMEAQRTRAPRILVPSWEEVRKALPAKLTANRPPLRIRWSLVCMGYQPELSLGWFACTSAFAQEAKQDRVFEESLFWVITRALHCFY